MALQITSTYKYPSSKICGARINKNISNISVGTSYIDKTSSWGSGPLNTEGSYRATAAVTCNFIGSLVYCRGMSLLFVGNVIIVLSSNPPPPRTFNEVMNWRSIINLTPNGHIKFYDIKHYQYFYKWSIFDLFGLSTNRIAEIVIDSLYVHVLDTVIWITFLIVALIVWPYHRPEGHWLKQCEWPITMIARMLVVHIARILTV